MQLLKQTQYILKWNDLKEILSKKTCMFLLALHIIPLKCYRKSWYKWLYQGRCYVRQGVQHGRGISPHSLQDLLKMYTLKHLFSTQNELKIKKAHGTSS